jgi:hypothetical protein
MAGPNNLTAYSTLASSRSVSDGFGKGAVVSFVVLLALPHVALPIPLNPYSHVVDFTLKGTSSSFSGSNHSLHWSAAVASSSLTRSNTRGLVKRRRLGQGG